MPVASAEAVRWCVCTMVEAEAVCVPFLCRCGVSYMVEAEAVCEALCARCGVSYMVEPQHMPSVAAEALCAVPVPLWICEAVCSRSCGYVYALAHGRAAARAGVGL